MMAMPTMHTEATRDSCSTLAYQQDVSCDVILQINDQAFPAHRQLLASHSEYFAIMFKGDFKESYQETIIIKGVTINSMEHILSFIYTGNIKIKPEIMFDLYAGADLLQFSVIQPKCASYMVEIIELKNCIDILVFSNKYNIEHVQQAAADYLCKHFNFYLKQNILFELPYQVMKKVLSSDQLLYDSELDILKAICQWFSHHEGSTEVMEGLLGEFRYGLVQPENLDNLSDKERAILGEYFNDITDRIVRFQTDIQRTPCLYQTLNRPRGPKCLVIIGGNTTKPFSMIDNIMMEHMDVIRLDDDGKPFTSITTNANEDVEPISASMSHIGPSTHSVKPSTSMAKEEGSLPDVLTIPLPHPVTQCATVTVGNFLYLIGGYNNNGTLDSLHRFDPVYQSWTLLSPMLSGMRGHTAAVLGNCILVIGDHVEMYDIGEDKWTGKADVPGGPGEKHAFVLSNQVYICSHQTHRVGVHRYNFLNVLQQYDAAHDKWQQTTNQHSHGWINDYNVCADEQCMYFIGGLDSQLNAFIHNTVEKVDPNNKDIPSRGLCDLPARLCNLGCATCGQCIMVCGGIWELDGDNYDYHVVNSIYVLDTVTEQWSKSNI